MKRANPRATPPPAPPDLDWLAKVVETIHPIDEHRPIFLRQGIVRFGPAIPSPHHGF